MHKQRFYAVSRLTGLRTLLGVYWTQSEAMQEARRSGGEHWFTYFKVEADA